MSQILPKHPLDPAQRDALKAELLQRHAALYPKRRWTAPPLPRLLIAAAVVLALGASFAAPAEFPIEVGRRITLTCGEGCALPEGGALQQSLLPLLQQLGQTREIQVRAIRSSAGLVLRLDLWGARLAPDAAERLRQGIPSLKNASIAQEPLTGRARTRLGFLLARWLLGLSDDPLTVAAAKLALQAELAQQGEHGEVDLQFERGEDGRRKVRVEIKAQNVERIGDTSDAGP